MTYPAYNFSYRSYLGFVENEQSKDYSDAIPTGNASTVFYHNIGASMGDQINNHNIWADVVGANTTDESRYPATEYFSKNYKNSKYYYAVKMARKTEEGNEVIIPYSSGNPKGSAYGVDNNEDAYVGFRIYANPETTVAPAIFDTIWSRAILFTKKKKQ